MCGLFGWSKTTAYTQAMSPVLALKMEARGHDSWGCTDGETIHKHLGTISEKWVDHGFTGTQLYHTRAASTGAVTQDNAHPFKFYTDELTVVGAHNGIISNHYALKNKYHRDKVEVDSQHIFMHLAERKSVAELDGWGAVIWWEYPTGKPQERQLYFSRFNSEFLHFARLATPDHEIVFASTAEAIIKAARFANVAIECWFETKPKFKYTIENDELVEVEEMPWEDEPVESPFKHVYTGRGHSNYGSSDAYEDWFGGGYGFNNNNRNYGGKRVTICGAKGCTRDIKGSQFLCDKCFTPLAMEYLTVAGA